MAREFQYFKLWISLTKKGRGMVPLGRQGDSISIEPFDEGRLIHEWPSNIVCPMKLFGEPDDLFIPGLGLWAISSRAKRVIEQFDEGLVQYLPISVIDSDQETEIGPYYVLNVLRIIEGLDYEHTRWKDPILREKNQYPFLNIFIEAYRREAINGAHVFRLSFLEWISREIVVSSILKKSMEKEGANRGIRFTRVPVY